MSDAQRYFDQVGCPILSEHNGSASYYVDCDQDTPESSKPAFGVFDYQRNPIINIGGCTASQVP